MRSLQRLHKQAREALTAPSVPRQAQNNSKSRRFHSGLERSDRQLDSGIKGEPGLRGEPAAPSAEESCHKPSCIAVWSAATTKNEGLGEQAFKG